MAQASKPNTLLRQARSRRRSQRLSSACSEITTVIYCLHIVPFSGNDWTAYTMKQYRTLFKSMSILATVIAILLTFCFSILPVDRSKDNGVYRFTTLSTLNGFLTTAATPTVVPAPTAVVSDPQAAQILAEAQNDISVANAIISWSAFFLALVITAVSVAGYLGITEFRRIRQLRTEFEAHMKDIEDVKQQVEHDFKQLTQKFEHDSTTFMEASYNFSVAADAYKVGDNIRSIEYYQRVLLLQPSNTLVMERIGRAYFNLDDIAKAIEILEQALTIEPSYGPALRSLALCYRYTDNEKAIAYLERCLAGNRFDYKALDFLGLLYTDKGLIEKAIEKHEEALRYKERPETEFYLSILYALRGDKRRARLMALSAEDSLHQKEHDERVRNIWKAIMQAAVPIIEGDEEQAFRLVQTAIPYITTQRIQSEFTTQLKLLLESNGHNDWIPRFIESLKAKKV